MSFIERLTNGFLRKMFNHSWEFCLQIISIKSYHFRAVSVIKSIAHQKVKYLLMQLFVFLLIMLKIEVRNWETTSAKKILTSFEKWRQIMPSLCHGNDTLSLSVCLSVYLSLQSVFFLFLPSYLTFFLSRSISLKRSNVVADSCLGCKHFDTQVLSVALTQSSV